MSTPRLMKAAFITETGPPSKIRYGDLPVPEPAPDELIVRTGAVSVNPIDTYIRGGLIAMPLNNPFVLGCDFAGTVAAVGSEVGDFRPGDRVWGANQSLSGRPGSFSEHITVPADFAYPTPENVTDQEAAAIALVGITAQLGLDRAGLKPDDIVFVSGGAGGVGSMVIQLAKAAGATVIASAGSESRRQLCTRLGADVAIDRHQENLAAALEKHAPDGIDIYWETSRQPDFESSVASLRQNGRLVLMAGREARPVFPVGPFYVKNCSLFGFAMFNYSAAEQRACANDLNEQLKTGNLKANVGKTFSLAETAEAHALQEANTLNQAGTLHGKIVLTP